VQIFGTINQTTTIYGVDVTLFSNGDSAGSVRVDGAVARVIIESSWYYLKGSAAFWKKTFRSAPRDAERLSSVWVAVRRSAIGGLGANLSLAHLRDGFDLASNLPLKTVATTQRANQRAAEILIAGRGKLWVSLTAPYRPIEYDGMSGGNVVSLQFSDWGRGSIPVVPPGSIQYS
jgi:hypothetical protein